MNPITQKRSARFKIIMGFEGGTFPGKYLLRYPSGDWETLNYWNDVKDYLTSPNPPNRVYDLDVGIVGQLLDIAA